MNICAYGASSVALDKVYYDGAFEVGRTLAEHGIGLVFGAGKYGVMGKLAEGALSAGGRVIGITPEFFVADGVIADNCTELIFTKTMRERKKLLEEYSQGFIVLPGGIGTLDEFFEMFVLKQLGETNKPIAVYNCNHYYDRMFDFLKQMVEEKFMSQSTLELVFVSDDIEAIVSYIVSHQNEEIKPITEYKNINLCEDK